MVTLEHRPSADFVHPIMHSFYCYPGNNSNALMIDWVLKLFFLEYWPGECANCKTMSLEHAAERVGIFPVMSELEKV